MTAAVYDDRGLTIHPSAVHTFTSAGDAAAWVAPIPNSAEVAHVLRFTSTAGQPVEVRLTGDDLAAIHRTAGDILVATPARVGRWLDQAAGHIRKLVGSADVKGG